MKFIFLILTFFSFSYSFACPAFSFTKLVCQNELSGQISDMKRFELVDRPDYQVLVSEVGSRLRTLVLPYESQSRNGVFAELYCDGESVRLDQYFGIVKASSFFNVNFEDKTVTQKGQILRVKDNIGIKIKINIICKEI